MNRNTILQIIRIVFILLFSYTGIMKVWHYQEFKSQIRESSILNPISEIVVWTLTAIEISIVILLLKSRWLLKGFYVSLFLMSLFTLYMILIVNFSFYIPCSCGGWLESLPQNFHILLNILLTVFAFIGALLQKQLQKIKIGAN